MNEDDDSGDWVKEDTVVLPIDGVLDLHTFSPKEIKELIPDYIAECRARNITAIRIIHGKGKGTLRRIVHSILDKHPGVAGYRLSGPISGGWGATEADLYPIVRDDGTPG